eukprot:363433-Chlamydomonas_euryale.AAC.14
MHARAILTASLPSLRSCSTSLCGPDPAPKFDCSCRTQPLSDRSQHANAAQMVSACIVSELPHFCSTRGTACLAAQRCAAQAKCRRSVARTAGAFAVCCKQGHYCASCPHMRESQALAGPFTTHASLMQDTLAVTGHPPGPCHLAGNKWLANVSTPLH